MNAQAPNGKAEPDPPTSDDPTAVQLRTLRLLSTQPERSQRQLSRELGLSVGKTHYILHALLDRGLVKIKNFKRSDNKWAYAYLLTPRGLREKVRLTHTFLARKEHEFELLRDEIERLRSEVRQDLPTP